MFKKKVQPEVNAAAPEPIPETAGEPEIAIRKEWRVGSYQVTLFEGNIHIVKLETIGSYEIPAIGGCYFPAALCKAIANALLQAAP